MVKQAKSVGQLIAALSRAAEEQIDGAKVEIGYNPDHGQYQVRVMDGDRIVAGGSGPKLFKLTAEVGATFLAARDTSAADKLRGRIGDLATMGASPEVADEEDEPSERY